MLFQVTLIRQKHVTFENHFILASTPSLVKISRLHFPNLQMHFPTGNWHQKVASPGKQQHSLLSGENFTIVFPKHHKCKSNWQAAPSSTYCSLVKISPLYFPNFTNANATGKRHQAAQVALWWKFHQEIPKQVSGAGQKCPDQYGRVKESSPTISKNEKDAKCAMDRGIYPCWCYQVVRGRIKKDLLNQIKLYKCENTPFESRFGINCIYDHL